MNKLPYETVWFSLEEYLQENTFGKPYLKTVPKKWKNEFSTVTEMYDTIMLEIQNHINLYFEEFFSHVDVHVLPMNKLKLIKIACYSTFVSKLYGMLITDKNLSQSFSNNAGYSLEENQTRTTNHYQDIFTPTALKALNQTEIKQLFKAYKTWEATFAHIKDKNFDYIYTAKEIDQLIELMRLESEELFHVIEEHVENRIDKFTNDIISDVPFLSNVALAIINTDETLNPIVEKVESILIVVLPNKIINDEKFREDIKYGVKTFINTNEELMKMISDNVADILDDESKFIEVMKIAIIEALKQDFNSMQEIADLIFDNTTLKLDLIAAILTDENFLIESKIKVFDLIKNDGELMSEFTKKALEDENFKNEIIANINVDLTNKIIEVEKRVDELETKILFMEEKMNSQNTIIEELKLTKADKSELPDMSNYYNKSEIGDLTQLPYSTKLVDSFNNVNKNYEENK